MLLRLLLFEPQGYSVKKTPYPFELFCCTAISMSAASTTDCTIAEWLLMLLGTVARSSWPRAATDAQLKPPGKENSVETFAV